MQEMKPKKEASELVEMLEKEKDVKFEIMSKEEAVTFLKEKNNYLRVASYRKSYEKNRLGRYVNLDFGCLVELSKIDMYLRNYIFKMCINLEHSLKVRLLKHIEENPKENGYNVVNEFLNLEKNRYIVSSILRKSKSGYSGKLIRHYFGYETTFSDDGDVIMKFDCPTWFLFEIISFGDFINFYTFYNKKYSVKDCFPEGVTGAIKSLRNACAHNNCIMSDLHRSMEDTKANVKVAQMVQIVVGGGKDACRKKLSNRFVLEFVCLIYVFNEVVSEQVRDVTYSELKEFMHGRFVRHIDFFEKQPLVKSTMIFLQKIVDSFENSKEFFKK